MSALSSEISRRRIRPALGHAPEPGYPKMSNIIEVHDLRKSFGHFEAVKGISFSVERGMGFGFLGPNGAETPTPIKILTPLPSPTPGTSIIDGKPPAAESRAVRRSLGIVFQDPSLDDDLAASE